MNVNTDNSVIVGCLVGSTVVRYVRVYADNEEATIKPLLAMFVAGTLLLGVAVFSTEIAQAFAVVLLVTTMVVNGKPVFDAIGKVTGTES